MTTQLDKYPGDGQAVVQCDEGFEKLATQKYSTAITIDSTGLVATVTLQMGSFGTAKKVRIPVLVGFVSAVGATPPPGSPPNGANIASAVLVTGNAMNITTTPEAFVVEPDENGQIVYTVTLSAAGGLLVRSWPSMQECFEATASLA